MGNWTTLCGDPTCDSYGCSQEAIDAWHARQQEDAGVIVLGDCSCDWTCQQRATICPRGGQLPMTKGAHDGDK
jgi:hypothetical protein